MLFIAVHWIYLGLSDFGVQVYVAMTTERMMKSAASVATYQTSRRQNPAVSRIDTK